MRFYSPLRYPGGKSKLTKHIVSLFESNNYHGGMYIEPFAGGAGLALSLLLNNYVENIWINDLDTSIYSIWKCIIDYTDEFCQLIIDTPITIKEWEKQKEIQKNSKYVTTLELGFSTFYLNRTNISGIIKGGVIGGYNQTGKYKIDARYNKENLIKRIQRIAIHKDQIKVTNLCVKELIEEHIYYLKEQCFIYFDPPYYNKGPDLYKNHLRDKDHLEIANLIKNINNHYWLITYDNVEEIIAMYQEFRKKDYTLNYSAGKPTKGKEIMIFSNNLKLNYENGEIQIIL